MKTQFAYSLDVFSEEEQQGEPNSLPDFNQDLIKSFKNSLPLEQILSYLTDLGSESSVSKTEELLIRETLPFKGNGTTPMLRPITEPLEDNFVSLQKWEGTVIEVMKDSFIARLQDLTQEGPDEEAEFSIEEVSEDDKHLVEPGAIFYWNIGYHDSRSGQRRRSSIIRFRRLPAWTKEDIETAKREAKFTRKSIGW